MILKSKLQKESPRDTSRVKGLDNENDSINSRVQQGVYKVPGRFVLESGQWIDELQIAYTTYGSLNYKQNNVIWACHALTGNADPSDWWKGLIGEGCLYDPDEYFIICANLIGSPYGSTNPLDIHKASGKAWHHTFPLVTVRDNVRAFAQLRQSLDIKKIHTLIGGSLGGHQALEWAISEPDVLENLVLCATSSKLSPWAVAFNQSQRLAIEADKTWKHKNDKAASEGLLAARTIALLSYRHADAYNSSQRDDFAFNRPQRAETYQSYQGEKLVNRFNAFSYYSLTKTMDSHDVGRQRGGIAKALKRVQAKTLIIAIESDILFPIADSKVIAQGVKGARLHLIDSKYGHDGFLLETKKITEHIQHFYQQPVHLQSVQPYVPAKKSSIALLGFGCVGQGIYELLRQVKSDRFVHKVHSIAVKNAELDRLDINGLPIKEKVCYKPESLIIHDEIKTVVEVINDDKIAFSLVKQALMSGRPVVSANKKMIAENLEELVRLQQETRQPFLYEGAVAGSIPILNQLNAYFDSEQTHAITGIINGSSNYILSAMSLGNETYDGALQKAQDKGFAEKNPHADVGGYDAKYKAVILALHAFGLLIKPEEVLNLGIHNIDKQDINYAASNGYLVKQVARLERSSAEEVCISVLPELILKNTELASVSLENNAIIVENNDNSFVFKGKGAGSIATGMAVLADLKAIEKGVRYDYFIDKSLKLSYLKLVNLYVRKKPTQTSVPVSLNQDNPLKHVYQEQPQIITLSLKELLRHKSVLEEHYFIARVPDDF